MSPLPIQARSSRRTAFPPFDFNRAVMTARIHAARLVSRSYAKHEERQDLVQSLLLEAWRQWPKFNAARGSASTFMSSVMGNHAISLARRRDAAKRGAGRCTTLTPAITDSLTAARVGPAISIDTADAIERLPDHLRIVSNLLKVYTVSETARRLGISRRQLTRLMRDIRIAFVQGGWESAS